MSNVSYLILLIVSIVFAIIGVNILYVYEFSGSDFNVSLSIYVLLSYMAYLLILRFFHPLNFRVLGGGCIYLTIFTFIPLLFGLMEKIECVVKNTFPVIGLRDDVQVFFLNTVEINIYIVIASLFSLGATWLFDFTFNVIKSSR